MQIDVSEIKINPLNPRFIRDEKFSLLVKSIKEFPDMLNKRPIVVNKDMVVLGGNMRLRACIEAGLQQVPVIVADWSEDQQREFIIKDNVSGGEWDWDILSADWNVEKLTDWGIDLPHDLLHIEPEEDSYEIPETVTTDIVPGDMFDIGPHRLLCASSLETDNYEKLLGPMRFDMILTDPPYNIDYTGKTKEKLKIQNDSMSSSSFYEFLYDYFVSCALYTKAGGAWYIWHADTEGLNFRKAFIDAGIKLSQCLIWHKNSIVMGRNDYHWQHEPCLYGWKEGASHAWYSDRKQSTILQFDRPSRSTEHPTMKPIPLLSYQISNSSKSGDLVGDLFLGSGSTMVAAHQLNRKCYGMEIDPKYCQVIIDRMKALDPQLVINKVV